MTFKTIARRATMAVAAIASGAVLFGAATGSAVADGHITGDDIAHYTLTKQHLKSDTVGSWETVDRSLRGGDIKQDSVGRAVWTPYLRSMVEQWEAGEFTQPGPEVVAVEQRLASGTHTVVAECPAGKVAVGGGYELSADGANGANTTVQQSQTTGLAEQADGTWQGTSHTVRATIDAANGNIKAVVNCAAAG